MVTAESQDKVILFSLFLNKFRENLNRISSDKRPNDPMGTMAGQQNELKILEGTYSTRFTDRKAVLNKGNILNS